MWKRVWEDHKSQRIREFDIRLGLLVTEEKLQSLMNMTVKSELNDTNGHANLEEKNPMGPQSYTKNNR